MKQVTTQELETILLARKVVPGMALFASIKQLTDARPRKTGNPFNVIAKLTQMTVILNTEYARGVQNQLKREEKDPGEYVAGRNFMPLEFQENNNFIGHFDGRPVLQMRPFENSNATVQYLADGKLVAKEVVEPWLPKRKERDPEDNRQGTAKEIHWRKVYLENVLEMTLDGETYKVVN